MSNETRVVPFEFLDRIRKTCMFTMLDADYHKLCAILDNPADQPADQQGEPVAYADPKAFQNFASGIATHEWMWAFSDNGLVPLYRHAQPAAAKVVLPERKRESSEDSDVLTDSHNEGWNACLDEVDKLNGGDQ